MAEDIAGVLSSEKFSLNPPYIEGKIPAFCKTNDGAELKVPFRHNRFTNSSIETFKCKIRTISTNKDVFSSGLNNTDIDHNNNIIIFQLTPAEAAQLEIGAFYKIQIAYVKNNRIGYYSDVGITKCTADPQVGIKDMDNTYYQDYYAHKDQYIGDFSTTDATEDIYMYQFLLKDLNHNILEDTGWQIHNSLNDIYSCSLILEDKDYYIQYNVITTNGLTKMGTEYTIRPVYFNDTAFTGNLQATLNFDNGYIELSWLDSAIGNNQYIIYRMDSTDDFSTQIELKRFDKTEISAPINNYIFKDFLIEQGVYYQYAIQNYEKDTNNNEVFSQKIFSNIIMADFEDIFLYDGKQQLKIRFNPDVSTFKNDILEQKTETIGSQYPIIYRNNIVHYKELAIKGLISYLMDEQYLFTDKKSKDFNFATNLTSLNIYNERQFKLEVLEWLNNGEIKLFKSPTEGNYYVRLMNISLSPNKTLGRMLHEFTATAYEVDSTSFNKKLIMTKE